MATAPLRNALDQPFPAGRAWAEAALDRLGLHPDVELQVHHVAQGWMRLGIGEDATLVDTLFVLTETQLGFGQVQVETPDPHWVPLSSIVAIDLIEGVPYPLESIEVQFAGGLAIFVGWPGSLSDAVLDALTPVIEVAVEDVAEIEPSVPFTADVPTMPPAPLAPMFGAEATPPGVAGARSEGADSFFADLEHPDPDPTMFSVSASDAHAESAEVDEIPDTVVAVSGPWDDPGIDWPEPIRNCVFLGGHPVHQRRRKNVIVAMRPGGLVIAGGGRGWSAHVPWHEVRRLDVQGADEVKFTHNHRIDLNSSAVIVELRSGDVLVFEVKLRRPATMRSTLAPILSMVRSLR